MNLTSEPLGQRRIISHFLFFHFSSLIFFLRACGVMIDAFQRIIRYFFLLGQVHWKLRRWNCLITTISCDLSFSLIAEPIAELDRQSFVVNVGSPHCMWHIVVIQYWYHLSPIVHINGKAQVRLALIRLMLISRADPSVFVSIAPSEGVGLFEHRTHRVVSWSHLTFIRGCYFIITHVAAHTLLCDLLSISTFVKRLVDWLDWGCFVL